MYDALTLNFALVILSFVYFIMSIIIYRVRREKYLLYYLFSFAGLFLVYLLLFFQKSFPDWISFILMNLLVLLSQMCVVVGMRVLYQLKPLDIKQFIYVAVTTLFLIYYTYIEFSINARYIILSAAMAIILIDLLLVTIRNKKNVDKSIDRIIFSIVSVVIVVWVSRIIVALINPIEQRYLVDQGFSTAIYYIIGLITISLWFSLYIWLETTQTVIKLRLSNEELSKIALIDNLTNLSNRHYFDHDLEFLIASNNRNKTKMTMLMIDLDRFKLVNDTYGHLVGDNVLKQTADILRYSVRSTDRIYRWGGEEFIILTPETDNSQAARVAEKICQNFRNAIFETIGNITVSIGFATYDSDEDIDDWFKRVDLALYQAKQTGRDKWVAWLDDELLPSYFHRFEWSSEYESGNLEVDLDHRQLAEYVNQLHDLIVFHSPIDTIQEHILLMNKHIQNHFAHEESVLKHFKYIDLVEHRAIHQRILSEYEIIVKKTINGDISLGALMSYLVEQILIAHILNDDKKFFNSIK